MRTAYFSLDRIPERSDCEKLLREYKLGKTLGKGAYGIEYMSYVKKVIVIIY